MNSVLLTVDLTKAVVDEAIERSDSVIIAYRMYLSFITWKGADEGECVDPIIFRGLKSLTLDNSQQQSLLRLAAEGISVCNRYQQQLHHSLTPTTRYIAPTPLWTPRTTVSQTGWRISSRANPLRRPRTTKVKP